MSFDRNKFGRMGWQAIAVIVILLAIAVYVIAQPYNVTLNAPLGSQDGTCTGVQLGSYTVNPATGTTVSFHYDAPTSSTLSSAVIYIASLKGDQSSQEVSGLATQVGAGSYADELTLSVATSDCGAGPYTGGTCTKTTGPLNTGQFMNDALFARVDVTFANTKHAMCYVGHKTNPSTATNAAWTFSAAGLTKTTYTQPLLAYNAYANPNSFKLDDSTDFAGFTDSANSKMSYQTGVSANWADTPGGGTDPNTATDTFAYMTCLESTAADTCNAPKSFHAFAGTARTNYATGTIGTTFTNDAISHATPVGSNSQIQTGATAQQGWKCVKRFKTGATATNPQDDGKAYSANPNNAQFGFGWTTPSLEGGTWFTTWNVASTNVDNCPYVTSAQQLPLVINYQEGTGVTGVATVQGTPRFAYGTGSPWQKGLLISNTGGNFDMVLRNFKGTLTELPAGAGMTFNNALGACNDVLAAAGLPVTLPAYPAASSESAIAVNAALATGAGSCGSAVKLQQIVAVDSGGFTKDRFVLCGSTTPATCWTAYTTKNGVDPANWPLTPARSTQTTTVTLGAALSCANTPVTDGSIVGINNNSGAPGYVLLGTSDSREWTPWDLSIPNAATMTLGDTSIAGGVTGGFEGLHNFYGQTQTQYFLCAKAAPFVSSDTCTSTASTNYKCTLTVS